MFALKGRYDGRSVIFDRKPLAPTGDVIVTFLDSPSEGAVDDGSLAYLFKDYTDDWVAQECQAPYTFTLGLLFCPRRGYVYGRQRWLPPIMGKELLWKSQKLLQGAK